MRIPFLKKQYPFSLWQFLGAVCMPLVVGFVGSLVTQDAIPTWYAALTKPPLSPPNWLFGPVWTLLYVLMGVASYVVWRLRDKKDTARKALVLYGLQLALNLVWSFAFFGARNISLGLIDILLLLIVLVVTTREFFRVRPLAGYLLLPYIAWIVFATYLNIALRVVN